MPSVDLSLPCVRCRYSLRSVDAMGRCPECGLAVVTTLAACTDSRLRAVAAIHRPTRVALLLLIVAAAELTCVVTQLAAPMLSATSMLTGMAETFSHRLRFWGWAISAMMTALSAVAASMFTGRGEVPLRAELGRWRGTLVVGLWAWSLAAGGAAVACFRAPFLPDIWRAALPWIGVATQLPGMAVALAGYSVLLGIAGRRSHQFHEAESARRALRAVNTLAATALVASLAAFWLRNRDLADWQTLVWGTLLASSVALSVLLLLVSAYLMSHAWLVARGLMKPPPRLDEVITEG